MPILIGREGGREKERREEREERKEREKEGVTGKSSCLQ